MQSLLAIDLPLGPPLEIALRDCAERRQAFCVLDQRLSRRRREEELTALGATSILDANGLTRRPAGQDVDDEIGLVMLTSGSSGRAKAAELTWGALLASAELTQATLRAGTPPVWFPCLPASHIGGLAVLLRAVLSDARLLWTGDDDVERAGVEGATHVSLVRAQLARFDVTAYYRVLLGGARPPDALPANVLRTWGMTETGSGVVYDGVPLAGVELMAANGELCVRTPTLFRSYRFSPRPVFVGPDGREWFPTGDAGDVVDGRIRVHGRLGFVINTGGEKLWPEDLEAALASVPGVKDVAVTGIDDPEWGQRVIALVVSDDNNPMDEALCEVATERLGPWAKPKEIRYVVAIPRTGNGKIRRGELANLR
ncbi:MAG: AMP-binding enzyme [Acidimicrobiales bacterium]